MILTILDSTGSTQGPNERRRYLQIGLLALALLLVGILGFRQVQRWMSPQTEAWVAAADLPAGATLGSDNVKKVKLAESSLPKGTVLDARALAGRELARAKQEGEPFTRTDFAATAREATAIAELVPEGRVLTTIRVLTTMVPYKNLKAGDRIDLVTTGGRRGTAAHVVARDAYVIGTMFARPAPQQAAPRTGLAALVPPPLTPAPPPTVGLLLGLHPEDALPLAQAAAGSGTQLQVVLHGKAEVASGQLLELPGHQAVEFIAGAQKKNLTVNP